jgi:hypothetical protein
VEESLRRWLDGDETPADFYELLGVQRFHPDRGELLQAIRKASRVLLLYQNHQGPELAQRARRLQMLLGEAEQALSEDDLWHPYEEGLLQQIRQQYGEGAGDDVSTWRPAYLRRWLEMVKNVHPNRLDELTAKLIPPSGSTAAAPALREVEIVEVDEPSTDEEYPVRSPSALTQKPTSRPIHPPAPPSVNRLAQSVDPPDDSHPMLPIEPAGPPAQQTDARGHQSAAPQSSHPQPPPRPSVPPGRRAGLTDPARLTPAANAPIGHSPFPGPSSAQGPERAAYPRQGLGRRKPATDSGLLWIVGSAMVTALVVGLICLAVMLPSLLRSRLRVNPSPTDFQEQTPGDSLSPPSFVPPPASDRNPPSKPPERPAAAPSCAY